MKCPICNKNEAQIDAVFGVLPCETCQDEARQIKVKKQHEFTSSTIRDQRLEYSKSHLQPFYNGQLSKEYIEAWGTDKIKVSKKEIKNAKYVYKHLPRWHKIQDSKI